MSAPPPRFVIAMRALVAVALVVIAGALPVRLIDAALDPFAPYPGHATDYGVGRARAIRAAIPQIADREGAVVVLGSSGIARAFVPSVFDATLAADGKRYESYNLAQLLLQPETTRAMARVLRETYEERHQRIAIAFFGVSVPELTRDSLAAARRTMPDQAFAFESASDIEARAWTEPLPALRDALELVAFGNVRPELTHAALTTTGACVAALVACHLLDAAVRRFRDVAERSWLVWPAMALAVTGIALFSGVAQPFIYFAF